MNGPICIDARQAPGFLATSSVWVSIQDHRDLDSKPRVYRSGILDVTRDSILLEKPRDGVGVSHVGQVFCISWLEKDNRGDIVRKMMDARLQRLDSFTLPSGPVPSMVFAPPIRYYMGSLRRHYRVAIPLDEDIHVQVHDVHGHPLGPRTQYQIMDLCLFGLRFSCSRRVHGKDGMVLDPVSLLQVRDRIRVGVIIEGAELLRAEAAIRTLLHPFGPDSSVVHLGVEFMKHVDPQAAAPLGRLQPFNDIHSQRLAPYIYKYQRMTLRKERGVA